ncbi:MAG: carboxypeptidase-like regulatory domain-containing protein [Candidatus Sulfotelmatobacter sp.]
MIKMLTHSISIRSGFRMIMALGLLGARAAPQSASPPVGTTAAVGYRIAGTVVSRADSRPLTRSRVTIRDAKNPKKFEFVITSEDGKYEFTGLPAGKYSLTGAKRGFISASYDQHDEFSTAIVTGAGIDTEHLVLRLAPDAVIAGKVLDEAGDPVRRATVTLYYDDHSSGVGQIHQFRTAQTDDLGEYELTPLRPGTYFLSASGKPWYAVHPPSPSGGQEITAIERSLDVAYPVTYYPDVTDADSALPIPIRGGEHVDADFHLNPVPSLHLHFLVPEDGSHSFYAPQLQQPTFDGYTPVPTSVTSSASPGVVEVTGIPAGRYNVSIRGSTSTLQMNGVDLTKDEEVVDTSKGEVSSTVKFSLQIAGIAALPQLTVALRSATRVIAASQTDSKGETELQQVAVGKYEVVVWGAGKRYSVAHISAQGAEISGHTLSVAPGSSPSVSLSVVTGNTDIQGAATKAGKGFAGAMVVLVPKNPEVDRDLFRRDQSDLDGSFLLHAVVPGAYTLLAIENGWDLDWSQPGVIAAYLKHGRKIVVSNQDGRPANLADPVEVQSK